MPPFLTSIYYFLTLGQTWRDTKYELRRSSCEWNTCMDPIIWWNKKVGKSLKTHWHNQAPLGGGGPGGRYDSKLTFFKEPLYNIDGVPRIVKKKLMTPNKHILVGEAAFSSLNYDTSFWTTTKNSWYPWNNTCPKEFGSLKTRQKIGVKSNPFKSLLANIKVKCKLFWTVF